MAASKIESLVDQNLSPKSENEAPAPGYHAPELRTLGSVELIRGNNSYDEKDRGNENYYL